MKSDKFATFRRRALNMALASALVMGGSGLTVNAYAATATGTATATVVIPIAIAASSPNLLFGSFSTATAGDTVTIAPDGTRSSAGALLVNSTNAPGAASFAVTGDTTLTYAITLPSTAQSIAIGAGTGTSAMAVTAFTSTPSGTGALTAGLQTLLVGATVTTVAGQVAGAYTGTFPVTVAYN